MNHVVRTLVFAVLAVHLAGCGLTEGQVVKTRAFGTATAGIGELGEKEFVNIRDGIIAMNRALVAIDHTKTSDSLVFDRPAYAEPTARRVAASKALGAYGRLLVQLATEDRSEPLQEAGNAFVNNAAVGLGKELSEEEQGAISGIIVGLGSFWVDWKKAAAAKQIIPAYRQAVDDLADLLQQDFSIADDSLGYLKAYETTARRLKNAAMRLVDAGREYSVLERERAVEALVLAETAMGRATALDRQAGEAIESLKKANAELVRAIGDKHYTGDDIKACAKRIQELVNIYEVLSH